MSTMKPRITNQDYANAAKLLNVDLPALLAVADLESRGSGFLPDGRPVILFEAHVFSRLTRGKYDKTHPNISSKKWNRKLYGASGVHQHDRLAAAAAMNRDAALQSCSWGLFQIMGFNHNLCGHASIQSFVNANYRSEHDQLDCLVNFIAKTGLIEHLRAHRWAAFAKGYNGPGYAQNGYHTKLEAAWKKRGGK